MRYWILLLGLASCGSGPKEEAVDYDRIVKDDKEAEWTSSPGVDGQHIAGDLFPDPQEIMIYEVPETALPASGDCR